MGIRAIRTLSRTGLTTLGLLAGGLVISSPASAAPEAPLTKPATKITATTATLHGELNPGSSSERLKYDFAYKIGPSCTEGSLAPQPPGEAEGNHKAVSVAVTGLEPSIQYTLCLIATNAEEELASGLQVSFTTLGSKPAVDAEQTKSESLTPFDAILEGEINPENQATLYHFEYATNPALTGAASIGEGSLPGIFGDQTVGPVDLGAGLTPATTYFYRVVATNATGTTAGAIQQLTTLALEKPVIVENSEAASAITQDTASLSAVINPEFQDATCKAFQYVDDATFKVSEYASASEVPCEPEGLGSSSEPTTASAKLTGLAANTTYHFRALAENATGLSEGTDQTFLTLPSPPEAITGQASSITANSATIAGSVNPGSEGPNSDTEYFFQYGPTTSYGTQVPLPPADVGQGTSPVIETANLTGLEPGATYHYRIRAANDIANTPQTAFGEDETFTTVATPPILSGVSVSGVTQSSVTITATLNSQGLPTRYELEVGSTPGVLQAQAFGNTAGVLALTLNVGCLSPGTVYYYSLIATNLSGTAEPPPEGAFTTAAGPGASSPLAQPATPPLLATPTTAFPSESPPAGGVLGNKSKRLTSAQNLANALKACRKEPKSKRASCERQARKRYGTAKKKAKKSKKANRAVSGAR